VTDEDALQEGATAAEGVTASVTFGKPEAELTHVVHTGSVIARKRASMLAHQSQISADHFMASMPDEVFEYVFGPEWFIVDDLPEPVPALFADLFQPSSA